VLLLPPGANGLLLESGLALVGSVLMLPGLKVSTGFDAWP
jgi:hypothetical protein